MFQSRANHTNLQTWFHGYIVGPPTLWFQANLTAHVQAAEAPGAALSASAGDAAPAGAGPPTVPLVSEQAPNVEHSFKQELQVRPPAQWTVVLCGRVVAQFRGSTGG